LIPESPFYLEEPGGLLEVIHSEKIEKTRTYGYSLKVQVRS